ncbi:Predicted arabinose efflux permease, MFS family [Kushneria avicenniae]|uniref:Predicted arabinose efflux permease, MFS family n=1 Tax=Kushneria avicenniae TaxID=402385 RepID=A0A1I1JPZ0_9GAMM|nr:MFS transporter [Kushneria avicenniae]SFC50689.1 Predicted arabinose efflux permease, MFS family [Kushneria avicenniae]
MNPALTLGATGFGLIGVCYGFARFAFGLFLPQIDADLALSSTLSGLISGGAFLGYCLAITLSAWLTERLSARVVSVGAALVAAVGMAGMAIAPSAPWLAAAVMLAGSSTGLASPPMAAAVAAAVRPERQSATNTVINAGTGAGVVMSGPVALMMGDQWRLAFAGFAVAAVALAIAAALCVPKASGRDRQAAGGLPVFNRALKHLIVAAFLMGAASTALWSFGGQLVSLRLDWGSTGTGLLWIAIGGTGIVGAMAGSLVKHLGMDCVHRTFLATMAAGIVMVGMTGTTPALALGGGLLFGLAYIMLTGVYLIWGVEALSQRPATGLMIGFLTIAIGQTAGAPVFGALMEMLSPQYAVILFAGLALTAGLARAGK